jgi:hypothetical protein
MPLLINYLLTSTLALSSASCEQESEPTRHTTDPIEHVIEVKSAPPDDDTHTLIFHPPEVVKTADDLLRALEFSDRGLSTLQASIMYDRVFDAAGDRQVRTGNVFLVTDPVLGAGEGEKTVRRRFAVHFTSLRLGNRLSDEDQHLIFDGRWLVERLATRRQYKKREIVREGEKFDPLRIGQGPFPLPIGQKREDILARYEAELLAPMEGLLAHEPDEQAKLEDFVTLGPDQRGATYYQLKLTPRKDITDDQDLREVRLWYREVDAQEERREEAAAPERRRLLPRLARTVNRAGDVSIIQLINVRVNERIEPSVFDTSQPSDPSWEVEIDHLPAPEAAPGG